MSIKDNGTTDQANRDVDTINVVFDKVTGEVSIHSDQETEYDTDGYERVTVIQIPSDENKQILEREYSTTPGAYAKTILEKVNTTVDSDVTRNKKYVNDTTIDTYTCSKQYGLRLLFSQGEQYVWDENRLFGDLRSHQWFVDVFSVITNESKKERFKNSIKHLTDLGGDDHIQSVLNQGSFRNVDHNRRSEYDTIDSTSCYLVSALASKKYDELDYYEGFAINKYGSSARFHAWNEVDGDVLDHTWDWTGVNPDDDSIYYGAKVDLDKLGMNSILSNDCFPILNTDNKI